VDEVLPEAKLIRSKNLNNEKNHQKRWGVWTALNSGFSKGRIIVTVGNPVAKTYEFRLAPKFSSARLCQLQNEKRPAPRAVIIIGRLGTPVLAGEASS